MKKWGRGFGVMLVSWLVGCGGFVVVGMVFVSGLVVSKVVGGEISATSTSCGRDGLHTLHLLDCVSGPVVTISNELVSSITQLVNLFLKRKWSKILGEYIVSAPLIPLVKPGGGIYPIIVDNIQFSVGVSGGARLYFMVEFYYSNPARLYYGEHTLCSCQRVQQGDPFGPLLFALVLHPLICKIRNSFSLSLQAWYLDDGTIVGDTLVIGKVLELIIKDGPRCGLHLNIKVFCPKEDPRSRLKDVFSPNIARPLYGVKLLGGPASVDFDISSELVMKRVAKTIGLMDVVAKINDPQCELMLLCAYTGISKLYFAMRTCSPRVFEMAQRSFDADLRSTLSVLSLLLDLGLVIGNGDLSPYLLCLGAWRLFNISDWLRVVLISGLGQTMNACSRVFTGDIYGDHVVSCVGIIDIKHRHNVVCDTLVDICFRSWISAGKEVDIGLGGGPDKPLRPPDMLLYSWDVGLDVCVDLTGSSYLTQTGLNDFLSGRAVVVAAHRCGDLTKADPKVLRGSRHWGTELLFIFLLGLVLLLLEEWSSG
nr:hypothetical protein [Tanacetum cinerariifolium]